MNYEFRIFISFRKRLALFAPALIGVRPIFKNGVIRAGVKGAGVKKGPAEKGPIRYLKERNFHGKKILRFRALG